MNAVRTAALAATGTVVAIGLTVVPAHAKGVDVTGAATCSSAGASNSIHRDVFTADGAGADTVTFTASRAGATCSGSVVVP